MSEPRIEDFARGRNFLELNQMRCGPVASIDSIGIPMDYWHSRCPRSDTHGVLGLIAVNFACHHLFFVSSL